jgi:beta-barrel assembly-enhancing protease
MKRIFIELFLLLAIGGLLWAAFAFFIKLPEHPTLISKEKEMELGEKYANVILSLNGFKKVENPALEEMLIATADRLKNSQDEAAYNYTIFVVDNEMVNAFALPGGYILLTKGLINFADTPEELIAVICHEIGHIEKRHVMTRLIKDIGLDILTTGDTFVMGEIARSILSSGYNRRQEEEADLFACELMLKSGLEPRSLASFFRKLKDEGKNELYENFEIISSHPNLNNRIKNVLAYSVPEDFEPSKAWINLDELKSIIAE